MVDVERQLFEAESQMCDTSMLSMHNSVAKENDE